MRFVAKNKPGEPYQFVEEMPAAASALLRDWWSGNRGQGNERRRQVGSILASATERKLWIACECTDQGERHALNPPVLFPREKDGVFSIQRGATAGRAEHAPNCPFRWEEGELQGRQASQESRRGPSQRRPMDFLLYKSNGQVAADAGEGGDTSAHGRAARDSLQQRLFAILEMAGVNRFDGGSGKPELDDRQRIREACKAVSLYDEADLEDIVWTSQKWYTEGWALKKLRRLRTESGWPGNVPMQGFFLLSVKDVDGSRVYCDRDTVLELERPVNVFAGAAPARSPYAVLISAKLDETADRLRLVRGYAHPRYTDPKSKAYQWSLCPVDSDYERQALGALLYVARKAAEQGTSVTIEKPLFDMVPDGSDEGCRPDFLARVNERLISVETMGSNDPDYRARKRRTHAIMRRLGAVIEDERVGVEPDKANRVLIAKVFADLRAAGGPT